MRLLKLKIGSFKNLQDFDASFDESSAYTVLVGENGAGKSNLIEAITLIFRNLDLEEPAPFDYEISYICRQHVVYVKASARETPQFKIGATASIPARRISKKEFMREDGDAKPLYRPAFVFGYYSGSSDRLSVLYEKHSERFYNWIIQPSKRRSAEKDANRLRRLFFAQTLHGQFALLAFFMDTEGSDSDDREFLRTHLQIEGLDSVLFVISKPPWARKTGTGDSRFWMAEGEVRQFLDRLYSVSMLPMRAPRRVSRAQTRASAVETLYLFLPNPSALEGVYAAYGDQYAFFTALESTHLSELLGEVRTRVKMTSGGGGGEVTYRELSEGEQQLLLVLGLLKFTARDEALFLLDEPDTHLNPLWGTQYLEFLDRFIRMRDREHSCHIILSSHDPLVFAGLKREQVQILRRGPDGRAVIDLPDFDPQGMGVAAILTSDLFRLRSTLDPQTQRDLDRQQGLAAMDHRDALEDIELWKLNESLRGKGLTQTSRDPLYALFVREWNRSQSRPQPEPVELSPDEMRNRQEIARQIVARLRVQDDDA